MSYYDGTKLLSLKDINSKDPEIYICTSNRSAGKTTYFSRYLVNRFLNKHEKFALLYRFNYELDNVASKFFKEIGSLFFNGHNMISHKSAMGIYHTLEFDGELCGYALALNNADQLKKYSHFFADTARIYFDEFQSESDHYCPNEIIKFQSLHTTIARGGGEQYRRVPVIMVSNPVTLLNPYYSAMRISSRLNEKVNFLRGDGWVLEQGYNESASVAQSQSGFNRAFNGSQYTAYAQQGVYLNDSKAFVEKMSGKCQYYLTIKYMDNNYGLYTYPDAGVMYCSDKYDQTFPFRIAVTTDDHQINYVMLQKSDFFIKRMRFLFQKGAFRFKNVGCKEAIMTALSFI